MRPVWREASPPPPIAEKPEPPDTVRGLWMESKELIAAEVAGPTWNKVCYYICVVLAFMSFVCSSIGILVASVQETVTSAEISLLDEMPFPAMFGCVPIMTGPVSYCPLSSSGCNSGTIRYRDGSEDCYEWAFGWHEGTGVKFTESTSSREREVLEILLNEFAKVSAAAQHWGCYLGNADGKLITQRERQAALKLDFEVNVTDSSAQIPDLIYMGLFAPGSDAKELIRDSVFFVGNFVDAINSVKIEYTQVIDMRDSVTAFFSDGKGTDGSREQALYTGSALVTRTAGIGIPTILRSSHFTFEAGSFVSQTISLRRKYVSEVWVQIGGAWATALFLLSCCFYSKVGGANGTVKIFRYNSVKSRRDLATVATQELSAVLRKTIQDIQEDPVVKIIGSSKSAGVQPLAEPEQPVPTDRKSVV